MDAGSGVQDAEYLAFDLLEDIGASKFKGIISVGCRIVPTDQWFTTHVDLSWSIERTKIHLLDKSLGPLAHKHGARAQPSASSLSSTQYDPTSSSIHAAESRRGSSGFTPPRLTIQVPNAQAPTVSSPQTPHHTPLSPTQPWSPTPSASSTSYPFEMYSPPLETSFSSTDYISHLPDLASSMSLSRPRTPTFSSSSSSAASIVFADQSDDYGLDDISFRDTPDSPSLESPPSPDASPSFSWPVRPVSMHEVIPQTHPSPARAVHRAASQMLGSAGPHATLRASASADVGPKRRSDLHPLTTFTASTSTALISSRDAALSVPRRDFSTSTSASSDYGHASTSGRPDFGNGDGVHQRKRAANWSLMSFSNSHIMEDHITLADYRIRSGELLEMHRRGRSVMLSRHLYGRPYFDSLVYVRSRRGRSRNKPDRHDLSQSGAPYNPTGLYTSSIPSSSTSAGRIRASTSHNIVNKASMSSIHAATSIHPSSSSNNGGPSPSNLGGASNRTSLPPTIRADVAGRRPSIRERLTGGLTREVSSSKGKEREREISDDASDVDDTGMSSSVSMESLRGFGGALAMSPLSPESASLSTLTPPRPALQSQVSFSSLRSGLAKDGSMDEMDVPHRNVSSWKLRWLMLRDGVLKIMKDKDDSSPLKTFSLDDLKRVQEFGHQRNSMPTFALVPHMYIVATFWEEDTPSPPRSSSSSELVVIMPDDECHSNLYRILYRICRLNTQSFFSPPIPSHNAREPWPRWRDGLVEQSTAVGRSVSSLLAEKAVGPLQSDLSLDDPMFDDDGFGSGDHLGHPSDNEWDNWESEYGGRGALADPFIGLEGSRGSGGASRYLPFSRSSRAREYSSRARSKSIASPAQASPSTSATTSPLSSATSSPPGAFTRARSSTVTLSTYQRQPSDRSIGTASSLLTQSPLEVHELPARNAFSKQTFYHKPWTDYGHKGPAV